MTPEGTIKDNESNVADQHGMRTQRSTLGMTSERRAVTCSEASPLGRVTALPFSQRLHTGPFVKPSQRAKCCKEAGRATPKDEILLSFWRTCFASPDTFSIYILFKVRLNF